MSGNNDGWSFNRFDEYEAKLSGEQQEEVTEEEVVEEGYGKYQKGGEVKGMHREADTGKVVDKAEVGKTYYPNMPKQKSSVALRKEKEAKKLKEQLEATGIFSAEEIESLVESNCGDRSYPSGQKLQKGGEVKDCEKCKGKGCDHCEGKGTHKKEEVKEAAKPDFLDMDGDGNKEEPMKKALKEKGKKKEDKEEKEEVKEDLDPMVEAAVAALAPLLAKGAGAAKAAGAAAKGAGAAAKGSKLGAMAKGAAKDAAADAAMDLGTSAVKGITSIPGKIGNAISDAAKKTVSSEDEE